MRNRATEEARRSDALYYSHTSRRELCNMVARMEEELRHEEPEDEEGAGGAGLRGVRRGVPDMEERGEAQGR